MPCLFTFLDLGLKVSLQLFVLVCAFVIAMYTVCSVSCLQFFYSRWTPCPATCKSRGGRGACAPYPMPFTFTFY